MSVTTATTAEALAERIRRAYETGEAIPPIRDALAPGDVDAAYAVQELNTEHWRGQGRRVVGRKIGLTSVAVQRQLGVDQPDFGTLFADMAVADGEVVEARRLLQPRIEAEVAVVIGADLPHHDTTLAEVVRAVDCLLPCMEIVASRIAGWDISITDTVADNASSGMFVLGGSPRRLGEVDLRLCGMVLSRAGEGVSVGAGAACLGHPLNAVRWLARRMAGAGRPLTAGDVVLSGALGPMVPVAPGDRFEARISGLGCVSVAFA